MRNGILKSMGIDEVPQAVEYEVALGFQTVFEPNKDTIYRLRAEHDARAAAGEPQPTRIELRDDELDVVTYKVHLARRKGGVLMAGGLVPQAKILGEEIDRIPKVTLFQRIDAAFAGMKG